VLGAWERGGQEQLIDLPPVPGRRLGKHLHLFEQEGTCAILFGDVPLYTYEVGDRAEEAVTVASLARARLATDIEIGSVFGLHRNTVAQYEQKLKTLGLGGMVPAKRGPKGPHKLTKEALGLIEENLELTALQTVERVYQVLGVKLSEGHVQRVRNRLRQQEQGDLLDEVSLEAPKVEEPAVAATQSQADATGSEPMPEALAVEPPAVVPAVVRGQCMGLALHFPALAAMGLVDIARSLYRLPNSRYFGVRAVMLTLYSLSVLGKTTVEAAKHLRRRELGVLIGTGRAPSVKTLRRKLFQLVAQSQAGELGQRLAQRWVEGGAVATAYLYVDGHMKVYSGKRKLAEIWNSQRRMPLAGLMTYFVGDQQGRPLLFITEEAGRSLIVTMPKIVAAIRDALGRRPFTVIFDRGGYNGALFKWLQQEGVPFITYQRGSPSLPKEQFKRREARFEGKRIRFRIAEDSVKVAGTGPWRRIVVRVNDQHQTPILTSLTEEVGAARIACLMFARWRQENFFRYMRHNVGLDQLVSYAYQESPETTLVPNPQRKRLVKEMLKLRKEIAAIRQKLGGKLLAEPRASRSVHGFKTDQKGEVGRLRKLEARLDELKAEGAALPDHLPLADTDQVRHQMKLEQKSIVDRVKITAYNAEEWLLTLLVRHYDNMHDVRDLLRSFAELSGEMRSTPSGVVVTLDPPDTPKHRRALEGLCEDLNAIGATYPGTDIPLNYKVAVHKIRAAA
jgi:hypothetical protein